MVEAMVHGFSSGEAAVVAEALCRTGWRLGGEPECTPLPPDIDRRLGRAGGALMVVAAVRDSCDAAVLGRCAHVEPQHFYAAGVELGADRALLATLALDLKGHLFFLPPDGRELERLFHDCRSMRRECETRESVGRGMRRLEIEVELATSEVHATEMAWFLTDRLSEGGFCVGAEHRRRTELALEEALLNAVEHGNLDLDSRLRSSDASRADPYEALRRERLADPRYARRAVRVRLRADRGQAVVEVTDEGRGITPEGAGEAGDEWARGRGFALMRRAFDFVGHEGSTLVLKRGKEQSDAAGHTHTG